MSSESGLHFIILLVYAIVFHNFKTLFPFHILVQTLSHPNSNTQNWNSTPTPIVKCFWTFLTFFCCQSSAQKIPNLTANLKLSVPWKFRTHTPKRYVTNCNNSHDGIGDSMVRSVCYGIVGIASLGALWAVEMNERASRRDFETTFASLLMKWSWVCCTEATSAPHSYGQVVGEDFTPFASFVSVSFPLWSCSSSYSGMFSNMIQASFFTILSMLFFPFNLYYLNLSFISYN